MEGQSSFKENSGQANGGIGEGSRVKERERTRVEEKQRHPTVEKKWESQEWLLNHFILLWCHLTKPSEAGKWLKIGHRHRVIFTLTVCAIT